MAIICETQRLILRELNEDDAEFIYELMNSEGWLEFIGDRDIKSLKVAKNYISEKFIPSYQDKDFGFWAVIEKSSSKAMGICGFVKREVLEHVDIGFGFLGEFMGQGYAYEASMAALGYGKTVLGLDPIIAITSEKNIRSQKLLEKLGMKMTSKKRIKEEWGESWVFE